MKYLTTLLLGLFLTFCSREPTVVERVQSAGILRVITVAGPATYYQGPDGPAGLEHDLASRFATELGVTLRVVAVPNGAAALDALARGEGDLVAAGLAVTPERRRVVRFGPAYQETLLQLVYRQGDGRAFN